MNTNNTYVSVALNDSRTVDVVANLVHETFEALKISGKLSPHQLILKNQSNLIAIEHLLAIRRAEFMDSVLKYMTEQGLIEEVPDDRITVQWQLVLKPSQIHEGKLNWNVRGLDQQDVFVTYFPDQYTLADFRTNIVEFIKENNGRVKFDAVFEKFYLKDVGPASMVLQTPIEKMRREAMKLLRGVLGILVSVQEVICPTIFEVEIYVPSDVFNETQILKQEILELFKEYTALSHDAITNKTRTRLVKLEKMSNESRHLIIFNTLKAMMKDRLLMEADGSTLESPRYKRGDASGVWLSLRTSESTQQETKKEFKMTEQAIDLKQYQRALEIIALQFVEAEIKEIEDGNHPTMIPGCERHNWYKAVRGLILDHAFEFRLSEPKGDEFGIPKEICKVQITKTIYPMEAWQIKAAFELLHNEGH